MNKTKKLRVEPIRCSICGRFISYDDLVHKKAFVVQETPDTPLTRETYDSYHVACESGHSVSVGEQELL